MDQKKIKIEYMGGLIILRPEGTFTTDDGREVPFSDAIKISNGSVVTILPFNALAALAQAYHERPEVRQFLEKNGVNLKKGLFV